MGGVFSGAWRRKVNGRENGYTALAARVRGAVLLDFTIGGLGEIPFEGSGAPGASPLPLLAYKRAGSEAKRRGAAKQRKNAVVAGILKRKLKMLRSKLLGGSQPKELGSTPFDNEDFFYSIFMGYHKEGEVEQISGKGSSRRQEYLLLKLHSCFITTSRSYFTL
eukprot:gene9453-6635_t